MSAKEQQLNIESKSVEGTPAFGELRVQAKESIRRSIGKALSWRIIAVLITATTVWVVTGEVAFAASIGVIDSLIKLLIYYLHERAWNRSSFGWERPATTQEKGCL